MRCTILSIGTKLPSWVNAGVEEYQKRFTADFRVELVELPLIKRNRNANIEKIKAEEANQFRRALPKDAIFVALDESGEQLDTHSIAKKLKKDASSGKKVVFLIGGPDGLSPDIREAADWVWSLSRLTYPHGLVRIILMEQLYRVQTVLANHPYHR